MDLSEFLLARIAEDEAAAKAASPGPWCLNAEGDEVLAVDGITAAEGFALSSNQQRATAGHIARHDPTRVLAECDAKRRIVTDHADVTGLHVPRGRLDHCDRCMILRLLALPYAGHEDYDEDWRP